MGGGFTDDAIHCELARLSLAIPKEEIWCEPQHVLVVVIIIVIRRTSDVASMLHGEGDVEIDKPCLEIV